MATPRAAIGTHLQKGDGASPEVFTTVATVGNITGPGLKGDAIDVTNHDNTAMYKQFIVGLKEGGDVKFVLYFDPTEVTHTGLISTFESRTVTNWKLTLPVSPSQGWTFEGVITAFDNKYDVNGALMADVTIKVSGKPSFA
jgi:predicted secreted protein